MGNSSIPRFLKQLDENSIEFELILELVMSRFAIDLLVLYLLLYQIPQLNHNYTLIVHELLECRRIYILSIEIIAPYWSNSFVLEDLGSIDFRVR